MCRLYKSFLMKTWLLKGTSILSDIFLLLFGQYKASLVWPRVYVMYLRLAWYNTRISTWFHLVFQNEMFNILLEEAERMHIKRKEASEMLKVINKQIRKQTGMAHSSIGRCSPKQWGVRLVLFWNSSVFAIPFWKLYGVRIFWQLSFSRWFLQD